MREHNKVHVWNNATKNVRKIWIQWNEIFNGFRSFSRGFCFSTKTPKNVHVLIALIKTFLKRLLFRTPIQIKCVWMEFSEISISIFGVSKVRASWANFEILPSQKLGYRSNLECHNCRSNGVRPIVFVPMDS